MRRWNWSLAWAVLRGRVMRIEHSLGYHENHVVVHLTGAEARKMTWPKR